MNQLYLFIVCLLGLIGSGVALRCLECNVWKAGYGHLCDNPLIRDDCLVCMKTETTIFMGYYKNTPRSSSIISRICAKSKIPEFGEECHRYDMAGGISMECYCNTDECNMAGKTHLNLITMITTLTFSILCVQRLLS